jgi:hypothetical protein
LTIIGLREFLRVVHLATFLVLILLLIKKGWKPFTYTSRPVRRKVGRGRGPSCSKRTVLPILL